MGVVIILVLIALYASTLSPLAPRREVGTASRGKIVEEVFMTGIVRAAEQVSLSFERGGSLRSLLFPVGTLVERGTIIATLENDSEQAAVAESKALVAIAKTNLEKINEGTRAEEIRLKEAEARKAEVSLENSKRKTFSVLADAYGAAEESLRRYANPLFLDDDTAAPRLTYGAGTQEAYDAEAKRQSAGASVKTIQKILQTESESGGALTETGKNVRGGQDLFITLGLTLREGTALDSATLADYRSRVTSARSALASAISSVQTQESALKDGAAELERVTRALELARAKATRETVAGAEHELAQAEAKLQGIIASLEKTLLRAPFRGQISSTHADVGETVQGGEVIMEFLGTGGFILEANVPEADIAKIEKGAPAEVTLDAYGEEVIFHARVTLIEPASREIEGVPTYKTTLVFEKRDAALSPQIELRSGLTANITMKKVLKENALLIPSRALSTEGEGLFVTKILQSGATEKVLVETGNRSGNREIEILKGLQEGDRILIPAVE